LLLLSAAVSPETRAALALSPAVRPLPTAISVVALRAIRSPADPRDTTAGRRPLFAHSPQQSSPSSVWGPMGAVKTLLLGLAAGVAVATWGWWQRRPHSPLLQAMSASSEGSFALLTIASHKLINLDEEVRQAAIPRPPEDAAAPDGKAPGEDIDGDADEVGMGAETSGTEKKERRRRERGDASSRVTMGAPGSQGFVSVRLESIALNYGTQEVLKNATWEVKTGERVGLVGANGGGKSTMLRMLVGEVEPSAGQVVKTPNNLKLAFLRQEFYDELDPTRTLKEELLSVFAEESRILRELKEAEAALEDCLDDPERMQEVIETVTRLQVEAEKKDASRVDSKVEKAIQMMGFSEADIGLPVALFSGGWKMRIGLGKVLLQEPNILLLDEPTNHLDLVTVEWLERFLQEQSLPMVIVSHDREFLNQVATKIVDIEAGETTSWEGNYETFVRNKANRLKQWQEEYEAQQKVIREARAYIGANKMNPLKASQVAKRERDLESFTMDPTKVVRRPPSAGKPFVFRFPPAPHLQEEVCRLRDVTHGYSDTILIQDASLRVLPGDRMAFLGPNGSGKSTLLRLILGTEIPTGGGDAGLGHRSVIANYFEQNQANALDLTKTVMESVQEASTGTESENDLRALLGKFLFKGDAIHKRVAALSGGEKARLALCRMMLRPANVLILDEPTNHLDIPAKEMLEEAIQHYDGTVLIVSHDRYFVSQTATTIVEIKDKRLVRYEGDYRYYLEKNSHVDEKVARRYLSGSKGIQKAKVVDLEALQKERVKEKLSKHFSRDNVTSGKKDKGVKNAKRMQVT